MKTCLNPATLRQDLSLDDLLTAASQAGFEGIELRLPAAAGYVDQHGLPALQARLTDANLSVASVGYPVRLGGTADEFERGLAELPRWRELAVALGARGGTSGLPWQAGGPEVTREETIERVGRLGEALAVDGLEVYLEFIALHVPGRVPWSQSFGQALDVVQAAGQPNVGVLIDSYHWHLSGSRAEDLARVTPGLPVFVHINDAPAGAPSTLDDSMRVLPGEGVLDLPGWLRQIRDATGYDGFVSLELFSERLRAMEPVEAALLGQRAVERLLAAVDPR